MAEGEAFYEAVGKFIYATQRVGGSMEDMANWMTDDLGMARLPPGEQGDLTGKVYRAFFAKHATPADLRRTFDLYMASLQK